MSAEYVLYALPSRTLIDLGKLAGVHWYGARTWNEFIADWPDQLDGPSSPAWRGQVSIFVLERLLSFLAANPQQTVQFFEYQQWLDYAYDQPDLGEDWKSRVNAI